MPGSTSGLFIQDSVLPRLGIAETVRKRVLSRGTESAAALAAGEADLALGPVSELVDVPGIEVVGPLPTRSSSSRPSRRRSSPARRPLHRPSG